MDVPNIMQAEFDENEIRKQFTVSERVALADDIMEEEKVAAKERQLATQFRADGAGQLALTAEKGQARKFAAQRAGLGSEGTYQRAKAAVTAGIPEVVEAMDKGKQKGRLTAALGSWIQRPANPPDR